MSAKTAKGWVVLSPTGSFVAVLPTRVGARTYACECLSIDSPFNTTWEQAQKKGYSIALCTITVTEEPTK